MMSDSKLDQSGESCPTLSVSNPVVASGQPESPVPAPAALQPDAIHSAARPSAQSDIVQVRTPLSTDAASQNQQTAAVQKPQIAVTDILNDPVTQHMGKASPLLQLEQTVEQALAQVRQSQDVGRIVYFYVVDQQQRLQGVVATRKLLLSAPATPIASLMHAKVIAIHSNATVLEACEYFTLHKLLAFPVVNQDNQVIGAVDIDLYTEEIQELDRRHDSEDLFQLIGVHLDEAAQGNARLSFLGRFPWLICNVGGGMLSALIADAYEDVSTLVVVAPFIALVTAMAESVSIQSVSLALQMLRTPPKWSSFLKKLRLELLVGLLLGLACGLCVGLIAWAWKRSLVVGLSLLLGITGGVVSSAAIGLSIPFLLRLFRRDPQLASGPIALAVSDVVTLLCYFNLGRWLLAGI